MPDLPYHPNLPIDWAEGIPTVTIDRPEARNSLTPEMIDGLFAALPVLDQDPGVSVIVLHRSGARVLHRARSARARQRRHRHRCEHRGRQPAVEHDRLPQRADEPARDHTEIFRRLDAIMARGRAQKEQR